MSEVFGRVSNAPDLFLFWCPGCGYGHHAHTGPGEWTWNGSLTKPTLSPSLLINKDQQATGPRCHLFVRDGRIEYCGDSTHELAGKTVEMVPWKDAG